MRELPHFVEIGSPVRDVEAFQCVFETLPPRIVFPDAGHAATEFFPLRLDTHTGGDLDGIRRQMRFLRIPHDAMDKRAVEQGDIHFFELAALSVEAKADKREVALKLKDFVIPPDDVD